MPKENLAFTYGCSSMLGSSLGLSLQCPLLIGLLGPKQSIPLIKHGVRILFLESRVLTSMSGGGREVAAKIKSHGLSHLETHNQIEKRAVCMSLYYEASHERS